MPRVTIDRERCKGCGLCVKFCPAGVIVFDTKLNKRGVQPAIVNGDGGKCTGCTNCAAMCPEAAIEIEEVPGDAADAAPTKTDDTEE